MITCIRKIALKRWFLTMNIVSSRVVHYSIGDVIGFKAGTHLAIYIGKHRVIPLWNGNTGRKFSVRVDTLGVLTKAFHPREFGHYVNYTRNLDLEMSLFDVYSRNKIIKRAHSRLGHDKYHPLEYTSEHFVIWARYNTTFMDNVVSGILSKVEGNFQLVLL